MDARDQSLNETTKSQNRICSVRFLHNYGDISGLMKCGIMH